jgi:uncharacterized membrane protein YeiH
MTSEVIAVPFWLWAVTSTLGGMSGAMHAARKQMDVFGTLVVAVGMSVMAGVIRDLCLGRVPAFLYTPIVGYAFLGGIAGYALSWAIKYANRTIFILDTLLLGAWVVLGVQLGLAYGLNPMSSILMGVITAVGGGVFRDLLCRDIPTAFSPVQFETASAVLVAVLYIAVDAIVPLQSLAEAVAITGAIAIRIAALRYRWHSISAVELSERLRGRRANYDPQTGTITIMKVQPVRR